jgi:hypothetical protein
MISNKKRNKQFAEFLEWEKVDDLFSFKTLYVVPDHLVSPDRSNLHSTLYTLHSTLYTPSDMLFLTHDNWLCEVYIKINRLALPLGFQLTYAIGTDNGNCYRIERLDHMNKFDSDHAVWQYLLQDQSALSKIALQTIRILNPGEYDAIHAFK